MQRRPLQSPLARFGRPTATTSYPDCTECAGLGFDVYSGRCRADAGPCVACSGRGYVAVRAATRGEAPTVVPSRWPAEGELAPVVVPRYPVPPNTDAIETMRPAAGGAA